jgi:2-polyprenyl-3-methyl-5-hydroxy-6-metoxy-1,4-benzoquinol methylase
MQIAAGIEACTVFELRATETNHPQVQALVKDLTYAEDVEAEYDLVTCLSMIEHVSLGRYGDPLDPWGDVRMAANLRRILRPGGIMVISFPSGRGCVLFNQHRIYTRHRRSALFGGLKLVHRVADRSLIAQCRQKAAQLVRSISFTQPIYVLQKDVR